MEPRLSELTRRLAEHQAQSAFLQYCFLLGKNAGRSLGEVAAEAKVRYGEHSSVAAVLKAAMLAGSTTDATWAAELAAHWTLTGPWVQAFSASTILGQLNGTRVAFQTRTLVEVAPPTAAWTGGGKPIPVSRLTFAVSETMMMKKIGSIVPFTDESFTFASPATLANMNDSLRRSVGYVLDVSVLDPAIDVSDEQPASLTNGVAPVISSGASAAQVTADISEMLSQLIDAGADPARIVLVMAPQTALSMSKLQTVAGSPAFPALGLTGGFVLGVPVIVSRGAALPGSPVSHIIAALAGDRILVADDGLITVDASDVASLQLDDAPAAGATNAVSLFQTHSRALRLIAYKNFQRARDTGSVAWMSVSY